MVNAKNLNKNQKIVYDAIKKANKPIKAYKILSEVNKKGLKAPPQIYRALTKLTELGIIHRIESRNAYVNCHDEKCKTSNQTVFSICENCDEVSEILNTKLKKYLSNFRDNDGNNYSKFRLELFGNCKKCQ